MSERTVLVDEDLDIDRVIYNGAPGMDAVPFDGAKHIAAVDDPRHLVDYGMGGFIQVPAVIVPEGTVRGGDRLRVTVELARGGADE